MGGSAMGAMRRWANSVARAIRRLLDVVTHADDPRYGLPLVALLPEVTEPLLVTVGTWASHRDFCEERNIDPYDRAKVVNLNQSSPSVLLGRTQRPMVVYWLPGYGQMMNIADIRLVVEEIGRQCPGPRRHFYPLPRPKTRSVDDLRG